MKMYLGQTKTATASVNGAGTLPDGASVRWETSDPAVVNVSANGPLTAVVMALALGSATVKCVVTDHANGAKETSGETTVTVETEPQPVRSVDVTVA